MNGSFIFDRNYTINTMKKSFLFLLIAIIFSSCDCMVSGSFENKTDDTVRVVCFVGPMHH